MAPKGFFAQVAVIWAIAVQAIRMQSPSFYRNQVAALNLNSILVIVGVVVGAIVGMAVLAALLPNYFTNTGTVVGTVTSASASIGNATVGGLMPTFGMLVAFAAVFGVVGLIIAIIVIRYKRSG